MSVDARSREADREAQDAVKDIYDDGEPVVVRYDGSYVPEGGTAPTNVAVVDVQTHAVFRDFNEQERAAGGVRETDLKILVAHGRQDAAATRYKGQSLLGLGSLQSAMQGLATGRTPKASGFRIYQAEEGLGRTDYPTPGGAGVRAWDVVRRISEVRDAGVIIVHELHGRAA